MADHQIEKTPGVYVLEENAFPNSVVQVETALPAFVGYTEFARRGGDDLTNVATMIRSMAEYEALFGAGPQLQVDVDAQSGVPTCTTPFLMYRGIRLFFANGGRACFIVSVGGYTDGDGKQTDPDKDIIVRGLGPLSEIKGPTLVLTPDTPLMALNDWSYVAEQVLAHCETLQDRMALLDLVDGDQKTGQSTNVDPIKQFHKCLDGFGYSYSAAYYPWLNTNLLSIDDISLLDCSEAYRKALLHNVLEEVRDGSMLEKETAGEITKVDTVEKAKALAKLLADSQAFGDGMSAALAAMNVVPPTSAIAGVITRVDEEHGPWVAPANVALDAVLSPTVKITSDEQEAMNAPANGMAVNAIRSFPNRGVLVWGARTLDANSPEWRYVPVRRTAIMIQQSALEAIQSFVFEPNDASTWATIKAMLSNYLTGVWKSGGLSGTTPDEAFGVFVGLGETMTDRDIESGLLLVTLNLALSHPAEFFPMTLQLQLARS